MINALTNWISDEGAPSDQGEGLIGAYALVYLGMAVSALFPSRYLPKILK
jgi:hypothetical protein